ncbi:MAG: hypothetical protein ABSA82_02375 [Thermacetogeniaceae bacterium]
MKKLIPWLIAAIVLQLCIYLYLNHLLTPSVAGGYTLTPTASGGVQAGVQQLFSYDGSFRADVSKDAVKIYSTGDDSLKKEIDIGATEKLTYFSWLQDRNIALAGISKPGKLGAICTLEPLNMVTDSQSIKPTITGLSKDAEIADVAYSTDTNVIYIQVKSGAISTIYRTDANNVLTKVDNTPSVIGRIANLKSEDALLYDSVNTGRVYLVDKKGKQWISPQDGSQYALIGTDKNDIIYITRLSSAQDRARTGKNSGSNASGRLADMILTGGLNEAFTPLQQSGLPYPVDSIRVTYDGTIKLT